MKSLTVTTLERTEFADITCMVEEAVSDLGIVDGVVTVFVPHTTAGITINENADPDVMTDVKTVLDKIVPWQGGYRHVEGNAAAHVKASLVGSSIQVVVNGGHLKLGTWQGIYFCEFDGPRTRKVWVERNG